jgi:hypothetical protein
MGGACSFMMQIATAARCWKCVKKLQKYSFAWDRCHQLMRIHPILIDFTIGSFLGSLQEVSGKGICFTLETHLTDLPVHKYWALCPGGSHRGRNHGNCSRSALCGSRNGPWAILHLHTATFRRWRPLPFRSLRNVDTCAQQLKKKAEARNARSAALVVAPTQA